jgi:3-hydroxybutyryl-CoA dehydrogenase
MASAVGNGQQPSRERLSDGRIAVLGAGTMGRGIAQLAAQAGYETLLQEPDSRARERALPAIVESLASAVSKGKITREIADAAQRNLRVTADLAEAVSSADVVIEAAPESLATKLTLLSAANAASPAHTVLASNTSSLSLTELAAASGRPDRVIGMHFFNPPPAMKLLEIVIADQTSAETVQRAREVGRRLGKQTIEVRDSPGFASSRLGIALALEAMRMLEEGVAAAEDIDRAMELGYNHPMGPLRLTDLVGLDVRLAIAEHLDRELGGLRFHPPQILRRHVKAGKLGKKSGEGFYKY